jgi:hypothetical protein
VAPADRAARHARPEVLMIRSLTAHALAAVLVLTPLAAAGQDVDETRAQAAPAKTHATEQSDNR